MLVFLRPCGARVLQEGHIAGELPPALADDPETKMASTPQSNAHGLQALKDAPAASPRVAREVLGADHAAGGGGEVPAIANDDGGEEQQEEQQHKWTLARSPSASLPASPEKKGEHIAIMMRRCVIMLLPPDGWDAED